MKDKITAKAVELFNGSGVQQTSFRKIASALGISDGHVRYYYKTKEDLLLALFEQMNQEILFAAKPVPEKLVEITEELNNNLNNAFTIIARYSFFFTEAPATFKKFAELGKMYKNLMQNRKDLLLNLFQHLTDKGYFKKEFTPKLQQQAFYSIFLISDSWIRHHYIMKNQKPSQPEVQFHSDLAFSILLPYIAEK